MQLLGATDGWPSAITLKFLASFRRHKLRYTIVPSFESGQDERLAYHAPESCHAAVDCCMADICQHTNVQRLLWRHLTEAEVNSSQPCRSQTIIWPTHLCLAVKALLRMVCDGHDELVMHGLVMQSLL